jgi:putative acetyltransferase
MMQQASVIAGTCRTPHESVASNAARFLAEDPLRRTLVAATAERVVGSISLHFEGAGRRRHSASLGMMVDEAFQGRGIGSALLDAAITLAERWMHVQRLELEVHVDNTRAIGLYGSRGFAIEGVARAYTLRDGTLIDAFRMARLGSALPYPRLTAEEAASRPPPALPRAPKPPRRPKSGGWGPQGGQA